MGLFKSVKLLFRKEIDFEKSASLKDLLLTYDVSYNTTTFLIDKVKKSKEIDSDLQKEIFKILKDAQAPFECNTKPFVIFMYGINGSGKTTTILKLANILQNKGKKVLVAACDTFRSAAADQLQTALLEISCPVIRGDSEKTEPAALAFNACKKTLEENFDVLIIDTAGRLHTNANLMAELAKIHKITLKNLPNSQHLNIAIMDATIGQNSISQIAKFNEIIPISGVIITKLDTSAKGGSLISVIHEMKKKVYFTCFGSKKDDIKPFNAEEFAKEFLE